MKYGPFFTYLSYVLRHKYFVFLECCKLGIPLRGLAHDWTKFLPCEFIPYMHRFGGGISAGRDKSGAYDAANTGSDEFTKAWHHHSRASHHWEAWVLPKNDGTLKLIPMSCGAKKEMLADWRGAGRAQGTPGSLYWYMQNKDTLHLHPETRAWIEQQLGF